MKILLTYFFCSITGPPLLEGHHVHLGKGWLAFARVHTRVHTLSLMCCSGPSKFHNARVDLVLPFKLLLAKG